MSENKNEELNIGDQRAVRLEKLKNLKEAGQNPYEITKYDVTIKSAEAKAEFEKTEAAAKAVAGDDEEKYAAEMEKSKEIIVSLAGRMMSKRVMGKAAFIDIQDGDGRIQSYVRIDEVGKDEFKSFKKWDIGDIVGITGYVFRTQKGEISVHAKSIVLLS